MTTVAITGGTGYLGARILFDLLTTTKYRVHAVVRDPKDANSKLLAEMPDAKHRLEFFTVSDFNTVCCPLLSLFSPSLFATFQPEE